MGLFSSRFNKLFDSVKRQFNKLTARFTYDFYDDMMNGEIAKKANPEKAAVEWYESTYRNNPSKYVRRRLMAPGTLCIFDYDDPLTKDKLSYWDRNPLVLVLQPYVTKDEKVRVRGINLHLLPPKIRKLVLWQAFYLYKSAYSAKLFNDDKRALQVNIEWKAIEKQLRKYGGAFGFRSYVPQRQKNIIEFNQEDWAKAAWIPSRAYEKTTIQQLEKMWREYLKKSGSDGGGDSHV